MSRLHVENGHSDPRRMIDFLRRKHAHRLITATAKSFGAARVKKVRDGSFSQLLLKFHMHRDTCPEVDQYEWKHPVLNLHVLGTIMVDAGSRAASMTIQRESWTLNMDWACERCSC